MTKSIVRVSVVMIVLLMAAPVTFAQAWPDVFNPFQILTLNLQLAEQDWDTIRHDTTNEIEVPAMFWADRETPILVSVRRKSSRALPSEADPIKVGLKIDINEFVDGQRWRSLTKVSLENGTDSGVVQEGFAWNLHRLRTARIFSLWILSIRTTPEETLASSTSHGTSTPCFVQRPEVFTRPAAGVKRLLRRIRK